MSDLSIAEREARAKQLAFKLGCTVQRLEEDRYRLSCTKRVTGMIRSENDLEIIASEPEEELTLSELEERLLFFAS